MRLPKSFLRDAGLLVLGVLTVAAAVLVLADPGGEIDSPRETALAPRQVPTPSPTPDVQQRTVRALFLGGDALTGSAGSTLPELLAAQLGWQAEVDAAVGTGFTTGAAGTSYVDRVEQALGRGPADVVVVVASAAATEEADGRRLGGNAQFVMSEIRRTLPEAEVVLVAPLSPGEDDAAAQREIFLAVAARFGAFYVDPIGAGYLRDRPELLTASGALTPAGAAEVAKRLASDLQKVLPSSILPAPRPTP